MRENGVMIRLTVKVPTITLMAQNTSVNGKTTYNMGSEQRHGFTYLVISRPDGSSYQGFYHEG